MVSHLPVSSGELQSGPAAQSYQSHCPTNIDYFIKTICYFCNDARPPHLQPGLEEAEDTQPVVEGHHHRLGIIHHLYHLTENYSTVNKQKLSCIASILRFRICNL
jgi:hypothetical protein